MRKLFIMFISLLISVFVLAACSNDTDQKQQEDVEKSAKESKEKSGSAKDSEESKEADVENQLDLVLGDTGVFETVLASYEMTVKRAEIIEGELEGEKSTRDAFIVLDIMIKNIGKESIDLEDVIFSMEVSSNLEHSGSTDHADGFDTFEELTGDLEPGKEQFGQFLTIIDETEEYFFRKLVGNIASGSSNQVIWTMSAEEAK